MADLIVGILLSKHVTKKIMQAKANWARKKERLAQAEMLYGRGFKTIAFSTAEKVIAELQENGIDPAALFDDPAREMNIKQKSGSSKEEACISRAILTACRVFFEASEFIEVGEFKGWIRDVLKEIPKSVGADNFNFLRAEELDTQVVLCKAFLDGLESLLASGAGNLPWDRYSTSPRLRALFNVDEDGQQIKILVPDGKSSLQELGQATVQQLVDGIKQRKGCHMSVQ